MPPPTLPPLREELSLHAGPTAPDGAPTWTLRDPVVTGAIVGGRSPQQIDGIIAAAGFRLTREEIAEIEG